MINTVNLVRGINVFIRRLQIACKGRHTKRLVSHHRGARLNYNYKDELARPPPTQKHRLRISFYLRNQAGNEGKYDDRIEFASTEPPKYRDEYEKPQQEPLLRGNRREIRDMVMKSIKMPKGAVRLPWERKSSYSAKGFRPPSDKCPERCVTKRTLRKTARLTEHQFKEIWYNSFSEKAPLPITERYDELNYVCEGADRRREKASPSLCERSVKQYALQRKELPRLGEYSKEHPARSDLKARMSIGAYESKEPMKCVGKVCVACKKRPSTRNTARSVVEKSMERDVDVDADADDDVDANSMDFFQLRSRAASKHNQSDRKRYSSFRRRRHEPALSRGRRYTPKPSFSECLSLDHLEAVPMSDCAGSLRPLSVTESWNGFNYKREQSD